MQLFTNRYTIFNICKINVLHHIRVKSKFPPYLKDQNGLIISFIYTIAITNKICNYKQVLLDLKIDDLNLLTIFKAKWVVIDFL